MGYYSARSSERSVLRNFRILALFICWFGLIPGCGGGRGGTGVSYSGEITRAGVGLPNVEVAVVNDRGETLFGRSNQNGAFEIFDPNSTSSATLALTDGEQVGEFELELPAGTTGVELQFIREAAAFRLADVKFSGPGIDAHSDPEAEEDPIDAGKKDESSIPPANSDDTVHPDEKDDQTKNKGPTPIPSPELTPIPTPTLPPTLGGEGQNPVTTSSPTPTATAGISCEADPSACPEPDTTPDPDATPPADDGGGQNSGGAPTLPGGGQGTSTGSPTGVGIS